MRACVRAHVRTRVKVRVGICVCVRRPMYVRVGGCGLRACV